MIQNILKTYLAPYTSLCNASTVARNAVFSLCSCEHSPLSRTVSPIFDSIKPKNRFYE